jgi:hypothetical protein
MLTISTLPTAAARRQEGRFAMKLARVGALSFALCVVGVFAEAAPPKPVSMVERVTTGQSRGSYAFRNSKYNKSTWGARWRQTLGRAPVITSAYIGGR